MEQLLNAQTAAVTTAQRFGLLGGFPFAPIAGMDPLPPARDESRKLADAASRVEILVGYTRNDADAFVAMDSRGQRLQRLGPPGRAIARLLGDVMTRRIFGQPALQLAKSWTSNGGAAATFPRGMVTAGGTASRMPLHRSTAPVRLARVLGRRANARPRT